MKLKREEHHTFVQLLDRTAEKNPLLWLPCVILLAVILGAEEIAGKIRGSRKPFGMRLTAAAVAAAFTFMFLPELELGVSAEGNGADLTYAEVIGGISVTDCGNAKGSIEIPSSIDGKTVVAVGNGAFENCRKLTGVTIPHTVKIIGNSAFSGCVNLTDVNIPDGVVSIGSNAFYGCKSLTSVNIPDSVRSVGSGAFRGCTALTKVSLSKNTEIIESRVFGRCMRLKSVTIPYGVTTIEDSAFSGSGITAAVLPESVTSIGSNAFGGKLTEITIPASVVSISKDAFENCGDLTIYGHNDSYACSYAGENGINFVSPEPESGSSGDDITVSLYCRLSGMPNGTVHFSTMKSYFDRSAVILVSNSSRAEEAAKTAMEQLGVYYPLEIGIYDSNGEPLEIGENGSITFELPIPKNMSASQDIRVYHIADGVPEAVECEIFTDENGIEKIRFSAGDFSYYLLTAPDIEDVASGAPAEDGSAPIDFAVPVSRGVTVPEIKLGRTVKFSTKKRRYRVLRKRRLDDLVFVY